MWLGRAWWRLAPQTPPENDLQINVYFFNINLCVRYTLTPEMETSFLEMYKLGGQEVNHMVLILSFIKKLLPPN